MGNLTCKININHKDDLCMVKVNFFSHKNANEQGGGQNAGTLTRGQYINYVYYRCYVIRYHYGLKSFFFMGNLICKTIINHKNDLYMVKVFF